jgi:hypothetical protein
MKRNRFIVILVVMAMSMLLVQGALAADEDSSVGPEVTAEVSQLDELLASIEADRSAAVDDLVNSFATDEATAEELRATLDSASARKLAEIVQNAESLEDVSAILAGTEGILALGDLDRDYVLTPVTPCRIVDTRRGGGGVFFPGQVREFFVYGDTTAQGGANCPSPRGEPRGVHINVTAVPQSGQGNFRAYPANVGPPNASLVNYVAGVQNVANAASVKTHFQLGTGGLKILNRVGASHLVVDILGYYHEVDDVPGVDWSETIDRIFLSNDLWSPSLLTSQTIDCPGVGARYVVATGSAWFQLYSGNTSPSYPYVRTWLSTSTGWDSDTLRYFSLWATVSNRYLGDGTISQSRVFTCNGGSSLTVRFFAHRSHDAGSNTNANEPSLVLTVYSKRY